MWASTGKTFHYGIPRLLQPLDALLEMPVLIQQFVTMICYLIDDACLW
jgi:hypothetical protein